MSTPDLPGIVINAAGAGGGLLAIALMIVQLRASPASEMHHRRALLAMIAILGLDCGFSVYELSPAAARFPAPVGGGYVLLAWLPTALWSYVDHLTTIAPVADRRRMPRHIAASCVAMLCLLPMLLLPTAEKQAFVEDRFVLSTAPQAIMLLGVLTFMLIWVGHLIVTGIVVTRRLLAHRQRIRDLCSDIDALDLRWLNGFLLFVLAGIVLGVTDHLLPLVTGGELLSTAASSLFEAALIFGLALFGLHQDRAIPEWADDAETPAPPIEPAPDRPEGRYARSSLSEADCAEIVVKLDRAMREGEPWRDPFLNLKTLAERISTRPYYVTQALNTELGRNFYDYVNGWRIRAACAALTGGGESVLAICEAVGFNSKSTFNTVFRKETGMTPSAYRRSGGAEPIAAAG